MQGNITILHGTLVIIAGQHGNITVLSRSPEKLPQSFGRGIKTILKYSNDNNVWYVVFL